MNTRFRNAGLAIAIALSLAGCSKSSDSSTVTGLTPSASPDTTSPAKTDSPLSPKPQSVTLVEGTSIKIRTQTTLSTKETKTGDSFTATLAEPIMIDGKVVAPRGSQVTGLVVDSDPGGRVKGVATISVRLTHLRVGDRKVEIQTRAIARQAHATKRKDAAKVGIGAGIGAAIGAIAGAGKARPSAQRAGGAAGTGLVLATHGDPAVIAAESVLTFKLSAPVTVEPS